MKEHLLQFSSNFSESYIFIVSLVSLLLLVSIIIVGVITRRITKKNDASLLLKYYMYSFAISILLQALTYLLAIGNNSSLRIDVVQIFYITIFILYVAAMFIATNKDSKNQMTNGK